MPSKNMLPKGKRRQSVKQDYRAARTVAQERQAAMLAAGEMWSRWGRRCMTRRILRRTFLPLRGGRGW